MNLRNKWFPALFVILALAACAQVPGQTQPPYLSSPTENNGHMDNGGDM